MPKKQPKNAFFYFMLDYKARCERNGERFPNGLRDVQEQASPEWNVMTANQKKKYEDMAKKAKGDAKEDMSRKETCWHNSFASIDRRKMEEEAEKNTMVTYIEQTVRSLSTKKLLSEYKFYLVHANYFCISEGECYHPAELAIAEFSLGNGVTNVYHTIIDPGQIPLGYRYDAVQKSLATHKIPVEANVGEQDFSKILRDIKKFLQPARNANGGEYPPLFTMPDNVSLNTSISAVKSVFENLPGSDSSNDYDGFDRCRIYSLEKLFFEIQNACCNLYGDDEESSSINTFPSISFARIELEKDVFNFNSNIACFFHHENDAVENCSKSFVQRWVFLICDHCCQYLNITVLPGQHLPENADVNYQKNVQKEQKKLESTPKPFTLIDHSKQPEGASGSQWVGQKHAPLRRPNMPGNLANVREKPLQIDVSDENFPAISIGRGRQGFQREAARGNSTMSFAAAMRSKK